MSRTEKIRKLSHAIWDYRGKYDAKTGKWYQPPKPKALSRIIHWLTELKLPVRESLGKIDAFENQEQFHKFLKEAEETT